MSVTVDYNWPDHPRIIEAGPHAFGLLMATLCYSDRQNLDGIVPLSMLRAYLLSQGHAQPDQLIEPMMRVGIFTAVEHNGRPCAEIHWDFQQWQQTAAEKDDRRRKKADAGRKGGMVSGEVRRNKARTKPEANAKQVLPENEPDVKQVLQEDGSKPKADAKENEAISNSISISMFAIEREGISSNNEPAVTPQMEHGNGNGKVSLEESFKQFFWQPYPNKKAKGRAWKAWRTLRPNDGLAHEIRAALERQRRSDDWLKDGGRFIPYPATWLNDRGWEDTGLDQDIQQRVSQQQRRDDAKHGRVRGEPGKYADL